ncbi:hypothetical protein [Spirosoma rigui]|uniref:hypothetical protein n=1 Tax=Spirosoma rigui TaxID=564064 RepID=UPI0009AF9DE5|nr:hypothetical protein [Spirosoma rigui]
MNAKLLFLGLGLFLFIASFWVKGDAFAIQLYATYYVIGWATLLTWGGLLLCLVSGVYFLRSRPVSRQ